MLLAVEDVGLGLLVVAVLHQSELYAVLDFLDGKTVAYGNTLAEVCCYGVDFLLVPTGYRLKCPYDGILDFCLLNSSLEPSLFMTIIEICEKYIFGLRLQ